MTKTHNPNALKLLISPELLNEYLDFLEKIKIKFDHKLADKAKSDLKKLELKERINLISSFLEKVLGNEKNILLYLDQVLKDFSDVSNIKGLQWWPISNLVETVAITNECEALKYMDLLTQVFTSEFCVRDLYNKNPKLVLEHLLKNSTHSNVHLRRWASEGTRPLLPWGKKAVIFKTNSKASLPILENLKFDDELYVRKSVANHLNDLSKIDPNLVLSVLKKWKKNANSSNVKKIEWIINHSLRTLIKSGNKEAIVLANSNIGKLVKYKVSKMNKKNFVLNDRVQVLVTLINNHKCESSYNLDYAIVFKSKSGKPSRKVYRGRKGKIGSQETIEFFLNHHLKEISTRKYYSGKHEFQLILNGDIVDKIVFNFKV